MTMLLEEPKTISREASSRHRMTAVMEALEERQLFSLLGIGAELDLPATSILGTGAGAVSYNATTHAFSVSGAPVSMIVDANTTVNVTAPSGFTISLNVDNAGNATSGATPATDVTLSGNVTIGNTTYSGTLLTGTIEGFGYQNGGGSGVDNFDFQFHVTGGQLATPYFGGKDIGVVVADENSNFVDFTSSFSATPVKGYIGSVPGSGSSPIVISGHKYVDQTGNGLTADDMTHPLAGVEIDLYNSQNVKVASKITGADGSYTFTGLTPDTYTIKEVAVAGYIETAPASGSYTVVATSGAYSNFDFDNYKMTGCCMCGCGSTPTLTTATSSLAGTVFADTDGDGYQDRGESGIAGVTITLTGTDLLGNTVSKTAKTDSYGNYKFSGLIAGNYTLTETQPSGYTDGKDSVGSLGGTLGNDTVQNITVPPCANGCNYNFGEVKSTQVCGNSGHGCCKVTITGCDQWGRSCTYTTCTDSRGNYCFNVCGGNYKVSECDSRNNTCNTRNVCFDSGSYQGKCVDISTVCGSTSSYSSIISSILSMFGWC